MVLVPSGDALVPPLTSDQLAFGTWEKIVETEVTGAAVTSITVTGLDLDDAKAYVLLFKVTNPTASASAYSLFLNNDTTATNYYRQFLYGAGTAISARRDNNAAVWSADPGEETIGWFLMIRDPAGLVKGISLDTRRDPAWIWGAFQNYGWVTTANVTRIDIVASITDAIGIGSKVIMFKVSK